LAKFSSAFWGIRPPAPRIGEHNSEVFREFGLPKDDIALLCRERGDVMGDRGNGQGLSGRLGAGTIPRAAAGGRAYAGVIVVEFAAYASSVVGTSTWPATGLR